MANFYGIQGKDIKDKDINYLNEELKREVRRMPTPAMDPQ